MFGECASIYHIYTLLISGQYTRFIMASTIVELSSSPPMSVAPSSSDVSSAAGGSNAILQRLKEMEMKMQDMASTIDTLESENQRKAEAIQKLEHDKEELSTERIKEMEEIFKTGINDWIDSLKGVSDDVKDQFKSGILSMAKKADIKNHAWEVVCNASQAHRENVSRIEELVRACDEKEKMIESLLQNHSDSQFRTHASRVGASSSSISSSSSTAAAGDATAGIKRPRLAGADEPLYHAHGHGSMMKGDERDTRASFGESHAAKGKDGDAWDYFASMIQEQSRNTYF